MKTGNVERTVKTMSKQREGGQAPREEASKRGHEFSPSGVCREWPGFM